jgi:hypothetical protein
MGWLHMSHPGHEGYIVGLVKDVESHKGWFSWRELRYDAAPEVRELDFERTKKENGIRVSTIQVACECGWRSPRIANVARTRFYAWFVETTPDLEDACRARFYAHLEQEKHLEAGFCARGRHKLAERCPDTLGDPCERR